MKVSFQKLLYLLIVLTVCAGTLLTGCAQPGSAGEDASAPSPSASASDGVPSASAPISEPTKKSISLSADTSVRQNWTEVNRYNMDLNGDKKKETIALFVDTQKDSEGHLLKGDRQNWVLRVEENGSYYTLFDEYVQNGNVYFEVSDYYIGDTVTPVITLVKSSGAEFKLIQYSYDKAKSVFFEEILYDSASHSKDGINQRYSSIPSVK